MRKSMFLMHCFLLSLLFCASPVYSADNENKYDELIKQVKVLAEELVSAGYSAGDGYQETWIRDFNTFMALSCSVNDHAVIKSCLINFLKLQYNDDQIVDGYAPVNKVEEYNCYYHFTNVPELAAHKNTVETDQETSLLQAVKKYIQRTDDHSILNEIIDGKKVIDRLENALFFLYSERYGLIWGGTTVDWGDVQPEDERGVVLNKNSHLSIDIYDNAMLLMAIEDYVSLVKKNKGRAKYWKAKALRKNIRKHLWDNDKKKFKPHIYLVDSPFLESFNEDEIYYHGGTAVAIQAGILTKKEVLHSYNRMKENQIQANASSIGLSIFSAYPKGYFKHPFLQNPILTKMEAIGHGLVRGW